jgi:fucose permease
MVPSPAVERRYAERRTLAALLVSGVIVAVPGEILPAWGYHITPDFSVIAHLFVAVTAGLLAGVALARKTLAKWGIGPTLLLGCVAAVCGLLGLAFAGPPVRWGWRVPGLAGLGAAVGLVNTAFFQAVSPLFRRDAARTVNLGGALFGGGSLLATLVFAAGFRGDSVRLLLLSVAVVPAALALAIARTGFEAEPLPPPRQWRERLADFTNPGAVLFTLLLFFQFGNEWTIASWLTLFLIQRLGISPTSALLLLAVYWAALTGGRLLAHWALTRISHWRLLFGSGAGALFGCFLLLMTDNRFGALLGVLLTGLSFAAIYPLVVERIGVRFPYYHPGFFNGVFSFGLVGGLLAPAHAGYLAERFGLGIVMLFPAAGTCMVLLLSILMWAEATFGPASAQAEHHGF